jgi:hypothetical protein
MRRLIFLTKDLSLEKTLFLEGTDSLSTNLHLDLFAVNCKCFGLQIRLPYFLSMALRKAYIVAVLLAFSGNFTLLHNSRINYTDERG